MGAPRPSPGGWPLRPVCQTSGPQQAPLGPWSEEAADAVTRSPGLGSAGWGVGVSTPRIWPCSGEGPGGSKVAHRALGWEPAAGRSWDREPPGCPHLPGAPRDPSFPDPEAPTSALLLRQTLAGGTGLLARVCPAFLAAGSGLKPCHVAGSLAGPVALGVESGSPVLTPRTSFADRQGAEMSQSRPAGMGVRPCGTPLQTLLRSAWGAVIAPFYGRGNRG